MELSLEGYHILGFQSFKKGCGGVKDLARPKITSEGFFLIEILKDDDSTLVYLVPPGSLVQEVTIAPPDKLVVPPKQELVVAQG